MSLTRSGISRGAAKVTWNGATFFSRDAINLRALPQWTPLQTSVHGVIDQIRKDFTVKITLRLWGAWENLSVLFPSGATTPVPGTGIYSTTDLPLVILARNGDQITIHNAQITKLADLYLGVDDEIYAADVEFTGVIADGKNPEDASAYYTIATGQSYTDTTFAKTNFKAQRYSAAWGAVAGFTAFQAEKGWRINWSYDLQPAYSANIGTYDMILQNFEGEARCIPIGQPTLAQLETAANAGANASNLLGHLLSGGQTAAADLVITGSGASVTLKNAGIMEHGYNFSTTATRIGEVAWKSTVGFTTGTAAARAALA